MSDGFDGVKFDYELIRDFAEERGWDSIDALVMIRDVTVRVKAR